MGGKRVRTPHQEKRKKLAEEINSMMSAVAFGPTKKASLQQTDMRHVAVYMKQLGVGDATSTQTNFF